MTDETEEEAATAAPQTATAKKTRKPKKAKMSRRRASAQKGPAAEPKPGKGRVVALRPVGPGQRN